MRIFLFIAVLMLPIQGFASGACDSTRSTADIISCESAHHKHVEGILNEAFDAADRASVDEELQSLKNTQKEWLEYRDQECVLESQQVEDGSLKRVQELRCLNRINEERVDALSIMNEDTAVKPIEIKAQPRWMNALASDYPDVFWRFGESLSLDLDCDSEDEVVMTGLRISPKTDALMAIVAVTEKPEIGRPQSETFSLFLMPREKTDAAEAAKVDKRHVCNSSLNLRAVQHPNAQGTCPRALEVSDASCEPHILYWTDGKYQFFEESEKDGAPKE